MSQPPVNTLLHCLGPDGKLAAAHIGFSPRQAQIEMARAIYETIQRQHRHLIVEAPTGVGKTLAYLLPSLLAEKKVIIATRTKALQEQLVGRDIPQLLAALGIGRRVEILKGKENYLSRKRLQQAKEMLAELDERDRMDFFHIEEWSKVTPSGDKHDCRRVAPNATIWQHVTGRQSDDLDTEDFCARARQRAFHADVLVVNQHLLCADLLAREEQESGFLPSFEVAVVDEAHAFPEVARVTFGAQGSYHQLCDLAGDCKRVLIAEARDLLELQREAERLTQLAADGCAILRGKEGSLAWQSILAERPDLRAWIGDVIACLTAIEALCSLHCERAKKLASLHTLVKNVTAFWEELRQGKGSDSEVCWMDIETSGVYRIHITPIAIAGVLKNTFEHTSACWIFTSATLSVGKDFSLFQQHTGLQGAATLSLDSPFHFPTQGLWYQPPITSNTKSLAYTEELLSTVLPLLQLIRGRALMLFTSYRALYEAEGWLKEQGEFTLFVQNSKPANDLISAFSVTPKSILLATNSFWEGVDIAGSKLHCVVIDKIPFPSPEHPLARARRRWHDRQGRSYFHEEVLPRAILQLKQGVGRLIRGLDDHGILVIGDNRLRTMPYGKNIVAALPRFGSAYDFSLVEAFCARHLSTH